MAEEYKKQAGIYSKEGQKKARELKLKEIKEGFAAKQNALSAELENELSKMTLEKRKKIEKWKRLELSAILKIEERDIQKELKNFDFQISSRKKEAENNYKKALQEISKKQQEIKKSIEELDRKKQSILTDNKNALKEMPKKEKEIENARNKLEIAASEREQIKSELLSLKPTAKFKLAVGNLIESLRQKIGEKKRLRKEKEASPKTAPNAAEEPRQEVQNKKTKEKTRQKPEEELNIDEEIKKLHEENKIAVEPKPGWLGRWIKKKQEPDKTEEKIKEKPEEKQEQAKPNVFGKLFGKIEARKPAEEKEKIEIKDEEPQKKDTVKSEADELEDSIRKLGLFKKIENEGAEPKEEKKKHTIFGKIFEKKEKNKEEKHQKPRHEGKNENGTKLDGFHKTFHEAKEAISRNDAAKAKQLYIEARNLYVALNNKEKKDVYGELMELYNKLSK